MSSPLQWQWQLSRISPTPADRAIAATASTCSTSTCGTRARLTTSTASATPRSRASLVHVSDDALGDLALAAPAPRLSETPGRIGEVNPPLHTDAEAVLKRWAER
jgi:crotonobetainyl-CoA:carnitine CoA-transferase CaiB-like acyl-CoA transferase